MADLDDLIMVKTEPAENNHQSPPSVSMDSIVNDLKTLEKHYVASKENAQQQLTISQTKMKRLEMQNLRSKLEIEDMKSKNKMLEKQNSKLKSDFEASEADKTLYYNQYQKYGRMLRLLQAENDSLKSKIDSSDTTKSYDFQDILDWKTTKMWENSTKTNFSLEKISNL